ncbi:MAG: sugar dehydrogenase [Acidimicrobiia bacterium]|nr:sugar dehydrogenase [Acidimicrobiia bacterium]
MAPTSDGVVLAMQTGEVGFLADREITTQATIPVSTGGERGLLGVAIHPDDAERWFFYYTNPEDGGTVVSEFAAPGGVINPESEEVLFTVAQPAANHNGGMIQFGPDGMLYAGVGDGGGGGDQFGNGQNTDTPLGGILRLDVDGEDIAPGDNPGFGAPELWLYGLRNPWRFDWSGDRLVIADVGQSAYEEITVVGIDDGGGNLGWPTMEGTHCYENPGCDSIGILPVHEIEHGDNGTCSITGGVTYEGDAIAGLAGHFLYSDFCGGYLRSITVDGNEVETYQWIEESLGSVVTFGEDEDGEVLISADGSLLRVVASN